jgi:adenylate cyclase
MPAQSSQRDVSPAIERRIVELHLWAVREGLRGAPFAELLEEFCRRLSAGGVPLLRVFAGVRTLHPQWAGYVYMWRRDRDGVESVWRERGEAYERDLRDSPFSPLIRAARESPHLRGQPMRLRWRLGEAETQQDFWYIKELTEAGATDYIVELVPWGRVRDAFPESGIGFSFATDDPAGFAEEHLPLIEAVLPAVSLAIMADAEYTIAAGLLGAYLGADAGRRVHAGLVERGSVESMHAVLWYADVRGFTAIADTTPGPAVIDLLDDTFEALTAALRPRGGQVLKFLGDGMLATFAFLQSTREAICRQAIDAAVEAMRELDRVNAARSQAGKPVAAVDLALHLGDVLYGNVGAIDRVDFTVIGPAVNEVSRIETLCEPLGRKVLVSAAFAAALGEGSQLEPLGAHMLRGLRQPSEIFALRL